MKDGVLKPGRALDIGSGLGIFPYSIMPYFKDVSCIEPNPDSAKFISNDLGIKCYNTFYKSGLYNNRFDFISCIHVLEHISDMREFLSHVDSDIEMHGTIYIEVPDAREFEYLSTEHDEFNSTHLYMFDMATLTYLLESIHLEPYLARRVKYKDRNLSRIICYANPS